jgi:hypothetical protein
VSPLFLPAQNMPATLARQVQINLGGEGVRAGGAYVGTLFGLMYAPLRIHGSADMPKDGTSAPPDDWWLSLRPTCIPVDKRGPSR